MFQKPAGAKLQNVSCKFETRRMRTIYIISTLLLFFTTIHGQVATPDNFLVFVGEKISLDPIPVKDGEIPFNKGFKAKYKILKKLYGNFSSDTIVFECYFHKGTKTIGKRQKKKS
jgi:hypothetical protein